jgi:branched-subunit amino acid ABC-type transport system permease component
MAKARRGRVLRAQIGCNPNSSSLGVDVTFLLFGAAFASALAVLAGALLRRSKPAGPPP